MRIIYVNNNYPSTNVHIINGTEFTTQGVDIKVEDINYTPNDDFDIIKISIVLKNGNNFDSGINLYNFSLINSGWYSMYNGEVGEIIIKAGEIKKQDLFFSVNKENEELIETAQLVYLNFRDTFITDIGITLQR